MAMYTCRTLDGPMSEWLNPPFRKVNFSDDPTVVLVSTYLRHAWTALPPCESPTAETVGQFMQTLNALTPEECSTLVPQNEDKDTIDTPWRRKVFERWSHVFVDVSGFLQEVGPGIGHFRTHELCELQYPHGFTDDGPLVVEKLVKAWSRVWTTNVLLVPAHVEPNVTLQAYFNRMGQDGTEQRNEIGIFNWSNSMECWYVRKGVEVHFEIDGNRESEKYCGGVAAVLAVGLLCLEDHGDAGVAG